MPGTWSSSSAGPSPADQSFQTPSVQRPGDAERPRERAAPDRLGQAPGVTVQMRTTAGQPPGRVGHKHAVSSDDAEQLVRAGPGAAAHAGAHGDGHLGQETGGTGEIEGAAAGSPESGTGSTSGRMSMRHPVSRAASRAFCPSRPMASDS